MVIVSDLRNGSVFEEDGFLWQVLSYEHIKMGRGSATIKVKVKNLRTGTITEKGFVNGTKVKNVDVMKKPLQFLYYDDEAAYFMDPVTFDQISVPLRLIENPLFLKEGESYSVSFLGAEALDVTMVPKVELKVAETAPGIKGNSASNVYKEAVMENGFKTRVPLFINVGDVIRIDTRTGDYTERA